MTENRNYIALLYSIVKRLDPAVALRQCRIPVSDVLEEKKEHEKRKTKRGVTLDDIRKMWQMKADGLTYKQIGDAFGKSDQAIHKLMKRKQRYVKELAV